MKNRDEPSLDSNDKAVDMTLEPGQEKMFIYDCIERDQPFQFAESLQFETLDSSNALKTKKIQNVQENTVSTAPSPR